MKLKKLQLAGFKSFFENTSIEFHTGISAIVGPNGCGKSNIIDALRWVMGEQSVKQLRGKSMEDVIFAGANGKHPLNMAEVSLILANDNGSTPEEFKDFTEIMLTRRLYRSGESAYLINKQTCRLKDIHNVFLGSGMGAKSYALIQQGNIGVITEAGPEERRLFVEEAAGVTRYKNRKNEALRKIQNTNQNILRVADIIAEIKRQMAGLKRQAKKAEIYKKHQRHIMELEVFIALNYYDDYTRRIEETDFLLQDLNDLNVEHTSKLKKLDSVIEEIKFNRSQKNQEIADQKTSIFETQRNIDKIENDLFHLRKDVKRLFKEAEELEGAHEKLKGKKQDITSQIVQIKNQNVIMEDEIKNVRSSLEHEQTFSQDIRDNLSELNHKTDKYKTDLVEIMAREVQYKNLCQNTTSIKQSLKNRLKRIDEEEVTANNRVAEFQKQKTGTKAKLDSLSKEIDEFSRQIDLIQKKLAEKNIKLARQVKLVQTIEFERNKIRSKHITLKKMEENFEWYKDGVKAIMKIQNQKQPAGCSTLSSNVISLIADVIETESSYETAVEAVFGDSLQYILVKDQKAGFDSINYLQTTNAGRSGFIPVSSIKKIERSHEEKTCIYEKLIDHISVKDEFKKTIEAILGHVVIAADIEDAIKIFNNNGSFQTIVTKNGDIISNQGVMIGGGKENLSGILAKKKEVKELNRRIAKMDDQLKSDRQYQKELEFDVRTIERDLQKLIERNNDAKENKIEAEKTLYKTTEDLKHAKRHFEIILLDRARLSDEKSEADDKLSKYKDALTETSGIIKTARDRIVETSRKIDMASSEIDGFNQRIVDFKLKLTALTAKLENNNNTLRRLEEFMDDVIERLKQLSNEVLQKKQMELVSKQKITEYEQTLFGIYDDMKLLKQAVESNEADYHAIDIHLKNNDNIISDMQSKRDDALRKIQLLEIEQSRQRLKKDNIETRIEECYHKCLSELRPEFNQLFEVHKMPVNEMEDQLPVYRKKIANIGDINLGAIKEYEQLKTRFDFLNKQYDDLITGLENLQSLIKKINRITQKRFIDTFNLINEKLGEVFPRLFQGGSARLILTEPDKPLETGVELMIHPPGKKLTRISLLSGGEKALSAIALIFSIYLIRPASFCLMDEIDAPLDEANIIRFNELLKIIGEKSQIVMITHNKSSMEFADTLFGITMENQGVSKIVSVDLGQQGS
ncbi:MAG: chromosome segregation protein SMC [Deltaproteobacteria bacterium]|nr:chromosome segregation protein SMC [Deltaproteobacteria bacterium]